MVRYIVANQSCFHIKALLLLLILRALALTCYCRIILDTLSPVFRKSTRVYASFDLENGIYVNTSARANLQEYFHLHMKSDKTKLFKNFDTYKQSLPVRECVGGIVLPLYMLNYYVREDELAAMATDLLPDVDDARRVVKYVAAPSKSGKTASVLPAFLKTEGKLTHYLYLAFSNNNEACFSVYPSKPNSNRDIAENQGAAFIFECVKRLLDVPNSLSDYIITLDDNPRLSVETSHLLAAYLAENLGSDTTVLFHLDEHKKMCYRLDNNEDDTGRDFSRGAMKALARISNAVVVATYVDPPLLDGFGSSTVCRYPVIRPRLDINKVIETVPELRFPHPCRRGGAQRRLATLKLRLAMKIQARIVSVLHLVDFLKDHAALAFLRDFRDSATLPSENAALDACNKISRITLPSADRVHPLASRILLGKTEVLEHDVIEWSKDIPDVVLVNHGDGDVTGRLVTSDLRTLLTFVDPVNNVFNTGRRMFSSYLTQTSVEDYLSSDPLEVAYAWVLATDSAVTGSISFTDIHSYSISCKDICFGRLFPIDTAGEIPQSLLEGLRADVLYLVDERRKGQAKHPLADLFFLTETKQLVLVSVTGSSDKKSVQSRRNKLEKWIQEYGGDRTGGYTVHGVLLAPFYDIPPSGRRSSVSSYSIADLRGVAARDLLRGLGQISEWFRRS